MTVHNFSDCLARSHEYEDAEWWGEVYQKAFPKLAGMVSTREDGWAQRGGIDRVLTLRSGKTVTIDEKVREQDWPDVALERWSNQARKVPGWVQKDLAIDFIAYAYAASQTCLLLPFLQLQQAWRRHGRDWIASAQRKEPGFTVVLAQNEGYVTESIAVPRETLLRAIQQSMVVQWGQP